MEIVVADAAVAREPGRERAPDVADVKSRAPKQPAHVAAVMAIAAEAGLLDDRSARISGRISPALIAAAKRQTGIAGDTDLISYALANLALEDPFVGAFQQSRGTVDPDLKLGY